MRIGEVRGLIALHPEFFSYPGAEEFNQYLTKQEALADKRVNVTLMNPVQVEQGISFIQQLSSRTWSLVEKTRHLLDNTSINKNPPRLEIQGGAGLFLYAGPTSVALVIAAALPSEATLYIAASLTMSGFCVMLDGALREVVDISLYSTLKEFCVSYKSN